MPTISDISNQIEYYSAQRGISIEEHPLLNVVNQYFQSRMFGFRRVLLIPNNTHLSDLIELFKPELQSWNLREAPSNGIQSQSPGK